MRYLYLIHLIVPNGNWPLPVVVLLRPSARQHGDDVVVTMIGCQLSDPGDECHGIADRLRPVRREWSRKVSVSPPCQRTCNLRAFGSGPFVTVMSRTSKRRMRLRSEDVVVVAAHRRGKSFASWRICRFCSAVTARMRLAFEGGQFSFEIMQALHGVVPARFERRCDQAVAGIDRLIAPFGEFGVIARPLDPHPPLGADAAIPFFQIGQRRQREFDRDRGDGAGQPLG